MTIVMRVKSVNIMMTTMTIMTGVGFTLALIIHPLV